MLLLHSWPTSCPCTWACPCCCPCLPPCLTLTSARAICPRLSGDICIDLDFAGRCQAAPMQLAGHSAPASRHSNTSAHRPAGSGQLTVVQGCRGSKMQARSATLDCGCWCNIEILTALASMKRDTGAPQIWLVAVCT